MILFMLSLILLFGIQPILCAQPQVQIEQGSLKGLYNKTLGGRKIATYLGIPYAKPLFGKDKFKEAVPAGPWMGVYNATRYSSSCLQLDPYIYVTPSGLHGVEDCLYLNVYTPKVTMENKSDKLYDVIVFIHGGGFVTTTSTFYEPSLLLDRDIVLVTFNYRTGPLGFLSTEDKVLPGNNGLKDQLLAMKWVKNNIRAFGGNPGSVTLAGLSAGGVSVHYHTLSPLSKVILHGKNLNFVKKEWDHLISTILGYNHTIPEARKIQIAHAIKAEYQINLDEYQGTKNFIEMLGDRLFVSGIYKAVKGHALHKKSPVYFYKFSYVGKHSGSHFVLKEFPGAFQGDDLLYILYSKFMSSQETEKDRILSKQMVDMWASFAANGTLRKPWLSVTEEYPKIPYINIKGPDDFKLEYAEDVARESFWDSLSLQEH